MAQISFLTSADEFVVKGEFFNQRLLVSASHFKIKQNNIVTPNPSFFIDPVNNPQSFNADLSNRDFEFGGVGGITKELSIIATALGVVAKGMDQGGSSRFAFFPPTDRRPPPLRSPRISSRFSFVNSLPPKSPGESSGPRARTDLSCQECGAFGAIEIGDVHLCLDCYVGKGACCAGEEADEPRRRPENCDKPGARAEPGV